MRSPLLPNAREHAGTSTQARTASALTTRACRHARHTLHRPLELHVGVLYLHMLRTELTSMGVSWLYSTLSV